MANADDAQWPIERQLDNPVRIARQLAAVTGERNYLWKGDQAGYFALHWYLAKHFPKRGACDECGAEAKTEHALIRGRSYSRNREDYLELCRRCHARYDHGGERNPQAKLTEADVREIRRRYTPGRGGGGPDCGRRPNSQRALAEEFGVSRSVIKNIVDGRKWTCVPPD